MQKNHFRAVAQIAGLTAKYSGQRQKFLINNKEVSDSDKLRLEHFSKTMCFHEQSVNARIALPIAERLAAKKAAITYLKFAA